VAFLWRHGEWAARDCDECRRFLFKNGRIVTDAAGDPIANPAPPQCSRTPCGSPEAKPRLEAWMGEVLFLWRMCRRYRALPRAGGVGDQDGFVMELFSELDRLRDTIDREELEAVRRRGRR